MLTPADEYLIHQTPYPFDHVFTSDRNFYDRYYFNGYDQDGSVYFAGAMGAYPNLGVMDAAINIVKDGKQRVLRASRALGADRMNTKVGPISVQVVEPFRKVRLKVAKNAWGIAADLVMEARGVPVEEARFVRKSGPVTVMDYTRITQHGAWSGKLSLDGKAFDLAARPWWGSRDHSWGVRGVGGRDPRGAPPPPPQFMFTWAPVNLGKLCTHYTVSENPDGTPWHESGAVLKPFPEGTLEYTDVAQELVFAKGTRHIAKATLHLRPRNGKEVTLEFEPLYKFQMKGIGYGDPKWGHGMWVGPDEVDGMELDLADQHPLDPQNVHVQSVSRVTAGRDRGIGIFESIILGAYPKYGFREFLDGAK